ncbi:hypothetical protein TrCOL_g3285 [Triparma columacea]|uniref:Uncharacterized protein n=1 Tax=Triparma columacea TaxID=722753 RepID=A0A9W7GEA9_9STRA|nr:hypothetical protein TrCOL_g3285 [Triparma columacea]
MKLFLLASMASCAAASFMKPNFSHLLEKGRRLQTEESFEDDDDDGPNCNGPEDCNADGDDDFCALPEKSSSYNLRRRLFADFKGYEGYCSDPTCMASSPVFYQFAASGQLGGDNFLTSMRDQGGCDEGGIADQFISHAEDECSADDLGLIQGFKSLGCSYGMACDVPSGALPTAEFCSECEGPLLDFLNLPAAQDDDTPMIKSFLPVMCQCPGFAAENLLESSTGNVCAFVNEDAACQEMIRALMIQITPSLSDFDLAVGACACNGEVDFENPDLCGLSDKDATCQEAVRDAFISNFQLEDGTTPTYDEASTIFDSQVAICACNGWDFENPDWCGFDDENAACQDAVRASTIAFLQASVPNSDGSMPTYDEASALYEVYKQGQTGLCACNGEWDLENPDWCGLSDLGTMCEEAVRDANIAYFQASVPNADGNLPTYDEASTMYEGFKLSQTGLCDCEGAWDVNNPDWCGLSDLGTMCEMAVETVTVAYFQTLPNADGSMPTYDEAYQAYQGYKSYELANCGV